VELLRLALSLIFDITRILFHIIWYQSMV